MIRTLFLLAIGVALSGCAPALKAQARMTHNLKIQEALADYQNAGAPLDHCVKAKLVAIAYEDAHESANATAWRAREREDCQAAIAAMGVDVTAARPGT
ncbi:hypothetical protein [Phenylobacterium sp.]|uniref:hypothetical protein n=1 Tax=Phenylobacterium sp. TaxID=1871053 RepID=UPI0025FB73D8|nr:hypothetical protein [Phenylobacterium sp.]